MTKNIEVEQYAPIRFGELDPATEALAHTLSTIITERAGKKIARYQRRRRQFVPVRLSANSPMESIEGEGERYIGLRANVIDPEKAFAASIGVTEIFKSRKELINNHIGQTTSVEYMELIRRSRVDFSDGEVRAANIPSIILPQYDIAYLTEGLNETFEKSNILDVSCQPELRKPFIGKADLPIRNTVRGEIQIFFGDYNVTQAHQATLKNVVDYYGEESRV